MCTCVFPGLCVHVGISVFCCPWQNETRLQEQLSSEPTAAGRQQIPEITCNGRSQEVRRHRCRFAVSYQTKTSFQYRNDSGVLIPAGLVSPKQKTTHLKCCQLVRKEDRSNHSDMFRFVGFFTFIGSLGGLYED